MQEGSLASPAFLGLAATICLSATLNSSTSAFSGTSTPTIRSPCSAIRFTGRQETNRRPSNSWSLKAMFSATVRLGNNEKS